MWIDKQLFNPFKKGYYKCLVEWDDMGSFKETNKENHLWSGYRLGAYINDQWYFQGGRASHEIVTQWYDFPDVEI